ncbi:MAG: Scr1 family TA system antitoxin-like transcriptional regulator [Streptosporangiaceae bacterium]
MKIHASQLERGAGAHAGLVGPFSILEFPERGDSDVAYTESVGGMIYLEKERKSGPAPRPLTGCARRRFPCRFS